MYPSFILKNTNTISTKDATQETPQLILPNIRLSTLIMYDPDSPNPSYLHWMIVNIPDGNVSNGNTIISYAGPSPPEKTGTHRYIFELLSQEYSILPRNIKRSGFSLKNFIEDNNLRSIKKQMFKVNT